MPEPAPGQQPRAAQGGEGAAVRRAAAAAVGPGRVLVLAYAFFVLAAGARSAVQISTRFTHAPLAYALSAVAAVVYLAGAVALATTERHPHHRWFAAAVIAFELTGVVLVGTATAVWPHAFPDTTVWSGYGAGYGYAPLMLPLAALCWLHWLRPHNPNPAVRDQRR